MGPLDVQIRKADELGEMTSGLTAMEALITLRSESFSMFEANLLDLKSHSGGMITLRTAMDIAQKLTVGLFEPMYAQIDPIRLGEDGRLVKIALEYGRRLDSKADNLEGGALEKLVSKYPTHVFEIDREEADELFFRVSRPTESEGELIATLGEAAKSPSDQTVIALVSTPTQDKIEGTTNEQHSENTSSGEQEDAQASEAHGPSRAPEEGEGIPAKFLKSTG